MIPGFPWLRLARFLTLLFCLFLLALFVAGIFAYPGYARSHPQDFTIYTLSAGQMEQILKQAGLSFDGWFAFNLAISVIDAVFFFATAILIFIRKRSDWFGLYLTLTLLLFGLATATTGQALIGEVPFLAVIMTPLGTLAWPLFFILFYTFPDGRFVPGWTRWAVLAILLLFGVDLAIYAGNTPPAPLIVLLFVLVAIGIGSQVYRFRGYSSPVQRQQTKWVVLAILLVFASLLVSMLPLLIPNALNPENPWVVVMFFLSAVPSLTFALIPISIAIAILRYRLFDIDIILRRTLQYGALSVLLILIYFGAVTLLQRLFTALTGQQSEAAIVVSTLLIAALFEPLRQNLQRVLDRRFFRQRYNAEQTLNDFSAHLRDDVDFDRLAGHLVGAVQSSLQPQALSLWMIRVPEKEVQVHE